jgi:copper chaperone CopZ
LNTAQNIVLTAANSLANGLEILECDVKNAFPSLTLECLLKLVPVQYHVNFAKLFNWSSKAGQLLLGGHFTPSLFESCLNQLIAGISARPGVERVDVYVDNVFVTYDPTIITKSYIADALTECLSPSSLD